MKNVLIFTIEGDKTPLKAIVEAKTPEAAIKYLRSRFKNIDFHTIEWQGVIPDTERVIYIDKCCY